MNDYAVYPISDVAISFGENFVRDLARRFSCGRNDEVDAFLRSNALEFTKRMISMTMLVFEREQQRCVGYFTLAHKPLSMPVAALNKTQLKRIARFAKPDAGGRACTLSAFLVAQIGKNRNVENGRLISGAKLLELAKDSIRAAQARVGGQVVFLEMEQGNAKLAGFYADNGFYKFGSRAGVEGGKSITYDQLFLFLK